MELKDSWKDVGKGIAGAGKSFGKAFIKTIKKGYNKVGDWAATEKEEAKEAAAAESVEAEVAETPCEPCCEAEIVETEATSHDAE